MSDDAEFLARLRSKLAASEEHDAERIAELEIHVQDAADDLDGDSLTREEKLLVSAHRLGIGSALDEEFRKVAPFASWKTAAYWAAGGVGWALGVQTVLEFAVPLGARARAAFDLPVQALVAWIVFVYVAGPIIAFASVGMWMRSRPASHAASRRALFITTLGGFALRIASVPLHWPLVKGAWRGIDDNGWSLIAAVSNPAMMMSVVIVAGAAALAFARFRRPIDVARQ